MWWQLQLQLQLELESSSGGRLGSAVHNTH